VARDIFARRKNGHLVCWYIKINGRRVALRTKDAVEARRRARLALAGQWPPPEEGAAAVSEGSFAFGGQPAPASSAPPPAPEPAPAPSGDWTQAAAGASSDAAAPPLNADYVPPAQAAAEARAQTEADNATLADFCVTAQIELTTFVVQQKVFASFVPPPLPEEGRALLASRYKQIFDYAGTAIQLPPWFTGLVIPSVLLLSSATVIGRGYAELARKQQREDAREDAPRSYTSTSEAA
jgi:hypothetical protein